MANSANKTSNAVESVSALQYTVVSLQSKLNRSAHSSMRLGQAGCQSMLQRISLYVLDIISLFAAVDAWHLQNTLTRVQRIRATYSTEKIYSLVARLKSASSCSCTVHLLIPNSYLFARTADLRLPVNCQSHHFKSSCCNQWWIAGYEHQSVEIDPMGYKFNT